MKKTAFEDVVKQWFYVLSYVKTESWYLINGITADFWYEFTLNNGNFSGVRPVLIDEEAENPIQDYLDAVLANIYHTGYINTPPASGYSLPTSETGAKIIPAEWMEIIQASDIVVYVEKMEWTIKQHEDVYKKRVAETIERGNQFL